jgi:hypothetical protein
MDLELLYREGVPNLLRDFSVVISGAYSDDLHLLTGISAEVIQEKVGLSLEYIRYISQQWEKFEGMMKSTSHPKIVWSLFLVAICGG